MNTSEWPTPEPPALRDRPGDEPDDEGRERLADLLAGGAWAEAVERWADGTALTEAEYRAVVESGITREFDLWADEDGLDYRVPAVPGRFDAPDEVATELDDLGRVVVEVLVEYRDRDGAEFGFYADSADTEE
jgi:hypothetical protein